MTTRRLPRDREQLERHRDKNLLRSATFIDRRRQGSLEACSSAAVRSVLDDYDDYDD